jgi:hypothetical protein
MYLCFSVLCLSLSYTHRHTDTHTKLTFLCHTFNICLMYSFLYFSFLCPSLLYILLSFTHSLFMSFSFYLCVFVFNYLTFPFHALQFVFLSCRLFLFNAYSLFLYPLSSLSPSLHLYLPTYPSKATPLGVPTDIKKRSYRHQIAFLQTT